ncbi:MAG: hypothetical protein ABSH02_04070 [Candidatus Sulfotelmatobacter sp.]
MKRTKNVFFTALTLMAFSAGAWGQTSGQVTLASNEAHDAAAAPAAPAPSVVTAADVQALKDALAAQQLQLDQLTQQLERQQAQQAAAKAASKTDAGAVQPVTPRQVAELSNGAAVQQDATPGLNLQETPAQPPTNPLESPVISIHFRGITITPGGFAEAAFVRRSRALGADLPTPFNSLTMPGASQNSLSEFFGSARQSRPTVYVDGRLKNVEFSSYISGDFLSSGDTSSATSTNSYTFRLRQAWGQAKFDNGWSFLGGQMWSLVTENKASIAPSDDLGKTNDARPMTIDPGYNVGFTFARQYGIRLTKNFGDKVAFAVAMENAQATLTTHNNADNFLLGEAGATNSYNDALTGCSISSYTPTTTGAIPVYYTTCTPAATYAFNPSPDIIAKLALDPGFGHYEIFGLFDRFRDRAFPCADFLVGGSTNCAKPDTSVTGAYNSSKNGGGVGANARWNFDNKHVVFGLHFFGGSGVGRYGAAQLSDLAIHANGTPDPIKDYQGLASLEWHGKKLDVYAYAGGEYAGRTTDYDANTGEYVGYGSPEFKNSGCYTESAPSFGVTAGFNPGSLSKCTADTRAIAEGTLGFWYRFYNGPRGKFQFGTQYSYVTRETWSGVAGPGTSGSPSGLDNMDYTSFRYYLP